jgi:alpha-galactosidase
MIMNRSSFVLSVALALISLRAAPPLAAASGNGSDLRTPVPGPVPRINSPAVYGCRPGHPFLYRVPVTGERPMTFHAAGLPPGLSLDAARGIITGSVGTLGTYSVELRAMNSAGSNTRVFKIVCGDTLALTPPMGWNDWYSDYGRITDARVRDAADRLIKNGMADAGYQYVNIDDCWANAGRDADPARVAAFRNNAGNILPNRYFPDMHALTEYIHAKGLKAGIYSSPGKTTCAGFSGSYGHEAQDARQFAEWGFDFLKYDWCSYSDFAPAKTRTLAQMKAPYQLMGRLVKEQNRDMLLNLCQYGMGDVWKWGEEVGAQSWRTSSDLGFSLNQIFEVALANAAHREWSKPGSWNDPDYIQIGWVGDARGLGEPQPTKLSGEEQYSFMSLWSLVAAPLFYSGDLTHLDAFTLNVLCNPEVIAVDQDPKGQSARVAAKTESTFLLVKDLADGSKAVGLCNFGHSETTVTATWADVGVTGGQLVRDLWREKNIGRFEDTFTAQVPARGVVLVAVIPAGSER